MTGKPRAAALGVTHGDYDQLLAAQGGGCQVCGRPPKTRRLHVDHDHRTGEVRGLLCMQCNRALPAWMTPRRLRLLAAYLDEDLVDEYIGPVLDRINARRKDDNR